MYANNFWWRPRRLFVLCDSFPRLTARLRGCAYYWQCLTVINVLLVHRRTLSGHCWCRRASKETNAALRPWIETSEKYGISAFIPFLPTVSCSTGFGFQSFASTLCVRGTCVGVHRAMPLIGETKQAMTWVGKKWSSWNWTYSGSGLQYIICTTVRNLYNKRQMLVQGLRTRLDPMLAQMLP